MSQKTFMGRVDRKLFFSWDKAGRETDFLLIPDTWTDEEAKAQIPDGGHFLCFEEVA